ncbi:MAG: hypothetical protein JJT75_13960 [Opitutales bacterium]|nr:hypothetical protein [Opitutales bacterium]
MLGDNSRSSRKDAKGKEHSDLDNKGWRGLYGGEGEMRKVRKFVVMIALLVLWGNLAHAENDNPYFKMEVVMEDRLVPFTPVPIEVVITNISGKEVPVVNRVRRAKSDEFTLKVFDEEDNVLYDGVASPFTGRPRGITIGPPFFVMEIGEELSFPFKLDTRGQDRNESHSDYLGNLPHYLFQDEGEYRLVFEYEILFFEKVFEDRKRQYDLRLSETLRSEVRVNVLVETEHEEAFLAVKDLSRYPRAALSSYGSFNRLIRYDLRMLQRQEGVFPDEEAMEEARIERRKEMHAELAEFLADHGDSPWAPYAWAVEARNTFIEHEDRVLAAEKALAAAEKHNVSHVREDMEGLLEEMRKRRIFEERRQRPEADLQRMLGVLEVRGDGGGRIGRLPSPEKLSIPEGEDKDRHGFLYEVDDVVAYREEGVNPQDVILLVEFTEGEFASKGNYSIFGRGERTFPNQFTLLLGDLEGGFIFPRSPEELFKPFPEDLTRQKPKEMLRRISPMGVFNNMHQAPESGYQNRVDMDFADLLEMEIGGNVFFYFKSQGHYGKGFIPLHLSSVLADQENFSWFHLNILMGINPSQGDRNLKTDW